MCIRDSPETFLLADEMLITATRIIDGLVVNQQAIAANLQIYGPFAATEKILIAAVMQGGDRQSLHKCCAGTPCKPGRQSRTGSPTHWPKTSTGTPYCWNTSPLTRSPA